MIPESAIDVLANVLDAVDPALSPDEQMAAAIRARDADCDTALAFAVGLLSGFIKQAIKDNPEVMFDLRKRAAQA